MVRIDRYGRGSAAANGEGFVDLAPGDTFAALEEQLARRISERFDNLALGISASIGSKRNASELAKRLASGEEEEVHKFAAKNIGVLFAQGRLAISHDDKKAVVGQRWITRYIRVFTPFWFAEKRHLATLTLKDVDPAKKIYAVEAVEINQDAKSGSTPRGAMSKDLNSAPFQDLTSQLASRIAYYVGDVNRTRPKFIGREESFTLERISELLVELMSPVASPELQTSNLKPQTRLFFSIIIPVYNVAPYLRECLDSVCAAAEKVERLGEVEVICVDDGSTDGSGEILDEYASRFNLETFQPFKVVHQENQGVAVARQVALEMCRGEWIAAVDPDDWVEPDYFVRLLEAATAGDVDMVWCGFTEEREGEVRVNRQKVAPDCKTQVLALLDGSLWGGMWMRLINRQFVVRHQLSFPRMRVVACEDTLFVASVLAAGARVKYVDAVGYHYRIRTDSSAHRKGDLQTYLSLMTVADRLEMVLREDWAAEPLRIWRKERLRLPYLDALIPDDVFFSHNGGCKDLWGSCVPFHHKLMYWFAARGWRRFLVKMIATLRRWRSVE